ncbi:glycosyltransferase [Mesorhizobium sp. M0913]|uniref:glycosyltransferase n=1 Tax=Mesorhizobium sp. M0913 TaxID=2957026 RepID=UPI003335F98A
MLAIFAHAVNLPSETFIRDHINLIAPGETVLLCKDGTETAKLGMPVLADIDIDRSKWKIHRAMSSITRRWRHYSNGGLSRRDRSRVSEFLVAKRVSAILAEYGPLGCQIAALSRKLHIPLHVHFHGFDASALLRSQRQVRHYRWMFGLAESIIVPSRYIALKLHELGCPADKICVSPCGVNPRRFGVSVRTEGQLIAIGRLVEKKAPHLTILAFGKVAAAFPESRLDIVGEGPLRPQCEALINSLNLQGRVRLLGAQRSESVATFLQRSAIFVQHSVTAPNGDTEGFPVAVLEAMACGLPVISTLHSGIPEAVEDGTTGFLVEEGDVDAMANAMSVLLGHPSLAAQMGLAGLKRLENNFTAEHMRQRLRSIMGLPACS